METKELIFNGKKFWQGEYPNYLEKNIVEPINAMKLYVDNPSHPDKGYFIAYPTGKVAAVLSTTGKIALVSSQIKSTDNGKIADNSEWQYFYLDDLIQNGGVSSSPLTHLYQGLQSFFRNEVIACL